MADLADEIEVAAAEPEAERAPEPLCRCESYARVTERAALAGARWLGRSGCAGS